MKDSEIRKLLVLLSLVLLQGILLWQGADCQAGAKTRQVTVKYEGKVISTDKLYGLSADKYMLIPCKMLLKYPETGVSAKYNRKKKKLRLMRNNIELVMYEGRSKAVLNEERTFSLGTKLRTVPMSGKKMLMVPAKKVCRLLGLSYSYNAVTRTIRLKARKPVIGDRSSIQSKVFMYMDTKEFVKLIGPIAQKDYHKNGVLASVTIAQAIHESWSGTSLLAQKGNNLFGMKTNLSGNSWKGSTWGGKVYWKRTREEYGGRVVRITAPFRKYSSVNKSIGDHSAYLKNAMNGSRRRYAGLTSTKSYKKQIRILQKGGYCTFHDYGKNLISVIKRYKLTRYDK